MRRRPALLSAATAGLLFAVAGGIAVAPAGAEDAPTPLAAPTTSAPTPTTAPATTTPTPAPTTSAPGDPVDLGLITVFEGDPTARGLEHAFEMDVSGTSPDATLTLTVPAALTVTSARYADRPVSCAPATGTVVCDLGAVDGLQLLTVTALVSPTAPIGSTQHVDATLAPVPGPDLNPGDNTVGFDVEVVGRAVVTQAQSVTQVDVPLGGSAPFTVTLHNDGPDPATNVRTRFTVQSNDTPRPELTGFTSADVAQRNGGFEWTPGTIPVGATVSLTVTVTALSPAVDSALSYSTGYDGVGEICQGSVACLFGAPIRTFVSGATGSGATPPELAATGSDDGPLAAVAVGLVLAGGALVATGRRRRVG